MDCWQPIFSMLLYQSEQRQKMIEEVNEWFWFIQL